MLFELAHQACHFAPVAQPLLGTQAQAQGGDMPALAGGESLQGVAGVLEAAFFQREFGFGHQPRRLQAGPIMAAHARRPFRHTSGVAQGVRSPPARQGQHAGGGIVIELGLLGATQGMPVTPFLQQAPGIAQGPRSLFLPPPSAEIGDRARQGQGVADGARQQVDDEESDRAEQQKQVERNLGTPRRQHQQHVAIVVARSERQPYRQRSQDQQPEYGAHDAATGRCRQRCARGRT